jgi:thiamine pyrophosphate-dependent acetolactate synthase large subunit-like protein
VDAPGLVTFRVVETVRRLTPAGTIAVFEDGTVWPAAARAWQAVAPGECLIAAEGFGVAAASAAQLARPDRRVVCFTNPAIRMARDQLETVAALALPVLIVDVGDSATFALSAGIRGLTAASIPSFATVFASALAAGAPALIAVVERAMA